MNTATVFEGVLAAPRVLILLSEVYADGGIQRFNRTFLSACDRLGITSDVLSLGDDESARQRWQEPRTVAIRVFDHDKVRFALAVSAALLRGHYDFVIIGHVNLLSLVAVNLAFRPHGKPRVVLIGHGIDVWTGMDTWSRRRGVRRVDLILAVSRYTAEMIRQQIPDLAPERFFIFPNALSETWTERFAMVGLTGARRLIPLGKRFLLSVTRLDPSERYKGIVSVIETVAMLEDTSVHYVVAGRGEDRVFLEKIAARLGVIDRVHFTGAVSDAELVALYRECSAFVLPSGKEGFGIVFLEAMFFGAPVVAAAARGAVDVVHHEENGLLVPYADTVSLRAAIERLLGDPALRDRIRVAGRAAVMDDGPFTFRAYVGRLAKVFNISQPEQ
jgi:phosphatidyl-myo-inositol dimannoside synthase